jgi:hypothetical protein
MPAVTTAAELLTYAAERGIAWMFMARIGVMQALTPLAIFRATAW